jgi:hypothetical protein
MVSRTYIQGTEEAQSAESVLSVQRQSQTLNIRLAVLLASPTKSGSSMATYGLNCLHSSLISFGSEFTRRQSPCLAKVVSSCRHTSTFERLSRLLRGSHVSVGDAIVQVSMIDVK